MASVKWRRVGLLAAVAMLIASPAWADIYFEYRLDPTQPAGITVTSDLKTGSVNPSLVGPGTQIKLNIYAIITNTATTVEQKKLSRTQLSEYSEAVGATAKIRGDLLGNPDALSLNSSPYVASAFRGALANNGHAQDISIPLDGDIDVGSFVQSGAAANEFFVADGGAAFGSAPAGTAAPSWGTNAAEFLIGYNLFTLTESVPSVSETHLQVWPRIKTDGTVTAKNTIQWWENGTSLLTKPGSDATVHVGSPIDLTTVPEPATLVMLGAGIFGFLVFRSRRKK